MLYDVGLFDQPEVVAVSRVPSNCDPDGERETEPPAGTGAVTVTDDAKAAVEPEALVAVTLHLKKLP